MTATVDTADNTTSKQEIKVETSPASSLNFLSSNYIQFGSYPQAKDGVDKTPIEWLVLVHDNNRALLISRYGLDSQPYNTEITETTWEKCTLRKWLNETFLNAAFSKEEQAKILLSNIDNSKCQGYSEWKTSGGNDTQDRVFLLSCTEANKYFNVTFENSGNTKARVKPTAYAVKRGTLTNSNYKTEEGKAAGWWWLRSPGFKSHGAARVYTAGSLRHCDVNSVDACVRPAMWVNLDSEIFRSEN